MPKEVFINSNVPEEVILAILCDFGEDQPQKVVQQILYNLSKLLRQSTRIKKYQKQLLTLSRLRKMELIVKTEVEAMTIHYDIETDGLYLQGKEEGIERGIEKGIELEKQQLVHKLWIFQENSLEKMAFLVDLSLERVTEIILAHLQSKGFSEVEATKTIAAYQAQFESK